MPRTYLIFGDIEGKLDTLPVECTKCRRKGRYSVRKLIDKYGRAGNMMKWKEHRPCRASGSKTCSRRLRAIFVGRSTTEQGPRAHSRLGLKDFAMPLIGGANDACCPRIFDPRNRVLNETTLR